MRFRIYCTAISLLLSSVGQAQEDPYLEWLKQQGGQQQPAPAPETPFPQAPPPAETPSPPPAAAPERFIAGYSAGIYYTSFVISGSRLEKRESKNGVPNRTKWVLLDDIELVEIGECGFYVKATGKTVVNVAADGQLTYTEYLSIASEGDTSTRNEAWAIANKIIAAVGARTIDVGDLDCY